MAGAKRSWSAKVTRQSRALRLEPGIFTWKDPRKIAKSLKRSTERSITRKSPAFQSAMSMLNFYINRSGNNISESRKRILNLAKKELRKTFGQV
ncbi:MAG: DUF3175 domain-containing protein [Patescibacteria group bacterium]|nr:DUF3175 domain-containing protein [Patescibacteria group bacterium]MCL5261854.1 DUF3175 domain-containing protein [Patescibacteria group bacterium]